MVVREFDLKKGAMLKIQALEGDRLRVRSGDVWITQHADSKDYLLKTGDSVTLRGKGATLATAYKPTLLDLYRKDPLAARKRVEGKARRAPLQEMWALFRQILA